MRRFLLGTESARQAFGEGCGVLLAQFEEFTL
jgi:hypothetical protein